MSAASAAIADGVGHALAAALGAGNVIGGEAIGPRYRTEIMGKYASAPAWLAKPGNTAEVAEAMRIAARHAMPVTVVGGQTGTCGGAIPRDGGLALSLERMNRIEEIDPVSMTMTVEAGCILQIAQDAAEAKGGFLPLDLGSRGSATVGGCIAANAGGNRVLRWGMMRDMVLGLEAVLADGTIVSSLGKMLKDNAGYDWKQLMIGSEGTLGIVTRAVLRLRPLPVTNQTALVALARFEDVTRLLRDLEVGLGGQLSSFEVMWREFFQVMTDAQLAARPRPMATGHAYYALVERLGGDPEVDPGQFERLLAAALTSGVIEDAVIASSERERQALWAVREDLHGGIGGLAPYTVYDVSVGLAQMEQLAADVTASVKARFAGARMLFYGHAGDGNLHLVVHVGPDGARHADTVDRLVYEAAGALGGSIAAEHGVGMSRAPYLALSRSPAELDLMRRIKAALDPHSLLNPGKILIA